MKQPKHTFARIHFRGGRTLTFKDQRLAYQTWLSLPRGIGAAFRGRGDHRPVYPWDYAEKPSTNKRKDKKLWD